MDQLDLILDEHMTNQTESSFTKDDIENAVSSGKNVVFSYPAGTGKTTAICEYISDQITSGKLNRKIIYVAPTKSLLDAMYKKLLETGVDPGVIFNYHSDSADYKACKNRNKTTELVAKKVLSAAVILITHERMKFDSAERFIDIIDSWMSVKPLLFLDESIEDCNVVCLPSYMVDTILMKSDLITPHETYIDFRKKNYAQMIAVKKIYQILTEEREYCHSKDCNTICHLRAFSIKLDNNVGFADNADLTDPVVKTRFMNLYLLIATALTQGHWLEEQAHIYINLPVAIHESWKHYAQIVIMDATAFINSCMCTDYQIKLSDKWNSSLLTNYVTAARQNSRTQLEKNGKLVESFLSQIPISKYNKIYMVTFKSVLLKKVKKYLSTNYPDYRIECFDEKSINECLAKDVDSSTDELYTDSTKANKIIYLTNFGRTRGSNKFRECECVVQIGNYRINPEALEFLKMIYPNLSSDQLALANFVQELYRGRIRCDKTMDSYSLVESNFLDFAKEKLSSLRFTFTEMVKPRKSSKVVDPFDKYGMNKELVMFLYDSKASQRVLHKKDLLEACKLKQWVMVIKRLKNLYRKHEELQIGLFSKYEDLIQLESVLRTENNGKSSKDIEFSL